LMKPTRHPLKERLETLLQAWRGSRAPSRWELMNTLHELLEWKEDLKIPGIWSPPPLLVTTTLDDGWGHGLEVIETCGRVAGLQVERLGLLQSAEQIIDHCRRSRPQMLGMTVLQLDTEATLSQIAKELKGCTLILVGGPPFRIDPELADRTKVDYVAKDVADFLDFLLRFGVI